MRGGEAASSQSQSHASFGGLDSLPSRAKLRRGSKCECDARSVSRLCIPMRQDRRLRGPTGTGIGESLLGVKRSLAATSAQWGQTHNACDSSQGKC